MTRREVVIYTDGASRGNPGRAGVGVVIKDTKGNILKRISEYVGVTTNNVAEYVALLTALDSVKQKVDSVTIFSDSELLVRQVKGEYKVRNKKLKAFYNSAMAMLGWFKEFRIHHISREENREADSLANKAINSNVARTKAG